MNDGNDGNGGPPKPKPPPLTPAKTFGQLRQKPADDGAIQGSFHKPCERCQQTGIALTWLWRSKKFVCPICAVNEAYDDAVKTIIELMTKTEAGGPFGGGAYLGAPDLRQLAQKIQAQQREQLEGKPALKAH